MEKPIYFRPRRLREAEKQKRVDELYDAMEEFCETLKNSITSNDDKFEKTDLFDLLKGQCDEKLDATQLDMKNILNEKIGRKIRLQENRMATLNRYILE
jgi:hypothetical protein